MLKSTVGTWVNYATTALFQVLFARRFGATTDASAYALTFAIALGLAASFGGATQAIYLPRLLTANNEVSLATLGRVLRLTLMGLVVFAVLAAVAPFIAPVIASKLNRPDVHFVLLFRVACGFGFLQLVVAQLSALCWVRGARFVPAVAPAIPSIVASVPLAVSGSVTPSTLYVLLILGGLVQVIVLILGIGRELRFSREPRDPRGEPPLVVSIGLFASAQIIGPFEILIASHSSTSGGADFNFAYRGLSVAQALIVGGVVAASLPDWSTFVRVQARRKLERAVALTTSMAALALTLAAAVGLVASTLLVRIAFQRGSFNAHDTHVVSAILVAALPGFVAEGVMLVLGQALAADKRTRMLIVSGQGRAALLILLVAILGLMRGPIGVAAGYSTAEVIALVVELLYIYRGGLLTRQELPLLRTAALVAICTGAVGGAVLAVHVPSLLGAALVVAAFAVITVSLRDRLGILQGPVDTVPVRPSPAAFAASISRFQSDLIAAGGDVFFSFVPFSLRRHSPRRRHEVPSAVIMALTPLFSYSGRRDAWVLRGIGERYGPVLRMPREPAAALEPFAELGPRDRRWRSMALAGVLAAAVLGFVLARGTAGESPPALNKHASAGSLEVVFPSSWRREAPPRTLRLGLRHELALVPTDPAGAILIIGTTVGANRHLLPGALRATLPREPPPQIVTLGRTAFYRYLNLSPRGDSRTESVYVLLTARGTIVGVCVTPRPLAAFTSTCELILSAIKLTSGPLPPGPRPSYAVPLRAVVGRLNLALASASSELSSAPDAQAQAAAELALSAAYRKAASALLRLHPGSAGAANSALAAALRLTANAYVGLAHAATLDDTYGYSAAEVSLSRATSVVSSAFAQLRTLGYLIE